MIAVSVLLGRVVVSLSEQIVGRDLAYRAPYAAAAVDIAVLRGRVILLCRLQENPPFAVHIELLSAEFF